MNVNRKQVTFAQEQRDRTSQHKRNRLYNYIYTCLHRCSFEEEEAANCKMSKGWQSSSLICRSNRTTNSPFCLLKKVNYKQATDKEMDGSCVNEKHSINCVLSSQNFPSLKNCGRNLPSSIWSLFSNYYLQGQNANKLAENIVDLHQVQIK